MPKKLEDIRKAVQRTGKTKDQAYAIATATYQKMKGKKAMAKKPLPFEKTMKDKKSDKKTGPETGKKDRMADKKMKMKKK